MKKSVIFWDFDGVIADSKEFVFNYWQKSFKDRGIKFTYDDFQKTFIAKLPFEYLRERFGNIAQEIFLEYTNYEKEYYAQLVSFFPKIKSIIYELSDNFQHNIISSNLSEVIEKTCKKQDFNNVFNQIIGRETTGYKDEKIKKILEEQKRIPKNCYMIGDTTSDIEHGKKAGTKTIGVTWGVHSRLILEESKPSFIVNQPEELIKTLNL